MRLIGLYDWDKSTTVRHFHVYIHNGRHYTGHCPIDDNLARSSVMYWSHMLENAYINTNEWGSLVNDEKFTYLMPIEYFITGTRS